ncbi:isoaspartyl peptidase/L-asparaginase [Pseudoflavitalea sp. G-6-1-2]|uniref:isoaspartyl peptidase/L-asparaginase family protein n=1 Tax=Pseudoflavitalea sp. G-6-1-2 TaxID=2728841 RepID=UPI00146EDA56|nr:isoaspartyl peptidase/L-asparaginase [Pseudoflavitalea sp. G-6-1-2]NML22129.1 isoaspartyl peptidase/L-asparaginase [Pseudoflavitalea sp. G-6-1-2]
MRKLIPFFLALVFNSALAQAQSLSQSLENARMKQQPASNAPRTAIKPVLVIHGGAGTILKKNMSPEKERAYMEALKAALEKGYSILKNGGSSLDAVEAAVNVMEDDPLFNAGKGAVFTHEGKNELDASIMNGRTLAAGAVAGVTTIRNPITAARAVMEKSSHVMMTGRGAEEFAKQQGLTIVDPSYFYTEDRWQGLQRVKKQDSMKTELDHGNKPTSGLRQPENRDSKYGTVGAVALDAQGNLAAATSTGGMTNKRFGRVGDSPIIGAGTYADNNTCAVSCTGWGEYFILLVMAKTVSDMMEFGHFSLEKATNEMVMKRLGALGGDGGLIAVDKDGHIAMPFNTEGMYRGYIDKDGKVTIKIYKD